MKVRGVTSGVVGAAMLMAGAVLTPAQAATPSGVTPAAKAPVCRYDKSWTMGAEYDVRGGDNGMRDRSVSIRTGTHPCFDRVVLQYRGWNKHAVRYQAVATTGTANSILGQPLPVKGGAHIRLLVAGQNLMPYPETQVLTTPNLPVVKQIRGGSSYRSMSRFNIGIDKARRFRVFELAGPGRYRRLVIDVAKY